MKEQNEADKRFAEDLSTLSKRAVADGCDPELTATALVGFGLSILRVTDLGHKTDEVITRARLLGAIVGSVLTEAARIIAKEHSK